MECAKIQESLSAYIEGILSPEKTSLLNEHITSCQSCRETLNDLRKTIEYVHNLEDVEPPSWLAQKIMSRVRAEAEPKKGIIQKLFYPLHIKIPIEAVATILIAVAAIYVFNIIQPEIKLTKAPAEKEDVITREEPPKQSHQFTPGPVVPDPETAQTPSRTDKTPSFQHSKPAPSQPNDGLQPTIKPDVPARSEEKQRAPFFITEGDKAGASAGTAAEGELKDAPLPYAAKLQAVKNERKNESMSLTISVTDMESARRDIEQSIIYLDGKIIKSEPFADKDIITAELSPERMPELTEKLQRTGDIKEKVIIPGTRTNTIELRIEIVRRLPQTQ